MNEIVLHAHVEKFAQKKASGETGWSGIVSTNYFIWGAALLIRSI